jgi:hypothetical protein
VAEPMAKQGYFFHSGFNASALLTACLDVNISVSHTEKSIVEGRSEKHIMGRCIVPSFGEGDKR